MLQNVSGVLQQVVASYFLLPYGMEMRLKVGRISFYPHVAFDYADQSAYTFYMILIIIVGLFLAFSLAFPLLMLIGLGYLVTRFCNRKRLKAAGIDWWR